MMKSPCYHCTRVRDPQNCENKNCKDWQAWFIDRWESMREYVRKEMEAAPMEKKGVPLGGNRYAHPHRVQEYLSIDPCNGCICQNNICHTPCPVKAAWEEMNKEVRK